MFDKVQKFVRGCRECSVFVDKKTKEPINHHKVPERCWETVAVDLFGPMPSRKHVVVVHDLASRFPSAKLVTSTKAEKVIPALGEIYDTYGNPDVQISDNGPPFNSKKMSDFANDRDIQLRYTPPLHPNANPAETCMKPIGKAMKINYHHGSSEKDALQSTLNSYRQTPHPATGVPPANMLFRDGIKTQFPRRASSNDEITAAKNKDIEQKKKNQDEVNSSKYRKTSNLVTGDTVLIRNFRKKSKFEPEFIPDPYDVIAVDNVSKKITLKICGGEAILIRHPNDIKPFAGDGNNQQHTDCDLQDAHLRVNEDMLNHGFTNEDDFESEHDNDEHGEMMDETEIHDIASANDTEANVIPDILNEGLEDDCTVRRSSRKKFPISRYPDKD